MTRERSIGSVERYGVQRRGASPVRCNAGLAGTRARLQPRFGQRRDDVVAPVSQYREGSPLIPSGRSHGLCSGQEHGVRATMGIQQCRQPEPIQIERPVLDDLASRRKNRFDVHDARIEEAGTRYGL